MASMTKKNGNAMAEDQRDGGDDEAERDDERDEKDSIVPYRSPGTLEGAKAPSRGGFFTIYKSGQGYWTRMGTAAGAGIILFATAVWLYQNLPVWSDYLRGRHSVMIGIVIAVIAAAAITIHWIMNKPASADFLIATDSEMKKVNWTTKADLIGSTKVVIFFVIAVTSLLFVTDLLFGYIFWVFGVLKTRPF